MENLETDSALNKAAILRYLQGDRGFLKNFTITQWLAFCQTLTIHKLLICQIDQLTKIAPPPVKDQLTKALIVHNELMAYRLDNLQRFASIARQEHLGFVLIKGMATSQSLYGNPFSRQSSDIDIIGYLPISSANGQWSTLPIYQSHYSSGFKYRQYQSQEALVLMWRAPRNLASNQSGLAFSALLLYEESESEVKTLQITMCRGTNSWIALSFPVNARDVDYHVKETLVTVLVVGNADIDQASEDTGKRWVWTPGTATPGGNSGSSSIITQIWFAPHQCAQVINAAIEDSDYIKNITAIVDGSQQALQMLSEEIILMYGAEVPEALILFAATTLCNDIATSAFQKSLKGRVQDVIADGSGAMMTETLFTYSGTVSYSIEKWTPPIACGPLGYSGDFV